MADSRVRNPSRLLLAVVLVVVPLGYLVARFLEVPGDRVTIGAIVLGILLFVGALALPALLLSGWQSVEE